jgi:hypothetical protein
MLLLSRASCGINRRIACAVALLFGCRSKQRCLETK